MKFVSIVRCALGRAYWSGTTSVTHITALVAAKRSNERNEKSSHLRHATGKSDTRLKRALCLDSKVYKLKSFVSFSGKPS